MFKNNIILGVVAVALIGVSVVLGSIIATRPQVKEVGVGSVSVVEKPTILKPEPVADPTTGWKVYRNEQYGFEMKYPPGWTFREREAGESPILIVGFSPVDLKEDFLFIVYGSSNQSLLPSLSSQYAQRIAYRGITYIISADFALGLNRQIAETFHFTR